MRLNRSWSHARRRIWASRRVKVAEDRCREQTFSRFCNEIHRDSYPSNTIARVGGGGEGGGISRARPAWLMDEIAIIGVKSTLAAFTPRLRVFPLSLVIYVIHGEIIGELTDCCRTLNSRFSRLRGGLIFTDHSVVSGLRFRFGG